MFKKSIFIVLLQALTLLSINAKDPEQLKIKLGSSVLADKGRVAIKFTEIVEDSRCPEGVACIWAGNARVKLIVSKGKQCTAIELNDNVGAKEAEAFGYRIGFAALSSTKPGVLTITVERPGK